MRPWDKGAGTEVQAALLALAGYTLWVLCDVGLKVAGASRVPALEVIALVGAAAAALVLLQARGRVRAVWPRRPARQALRALLDLGNNVCVLLALRHVSLATFYLLVFLAPLLAAALAAALLRERLLRGQVIALLVGFAGVVVAVGGARTGDAVGYAACLVCVGCFSLNMVWSRQMTQTESAPSMAFFSGLVIAVLAGAAAVPRLQPVPGATALAIVAVAAAGVLGNLCFFWALRRARTAFVSQFHYSQLPVGAAVGYAVWAERVTPAMALGAVLIAGAGVWTATHAGNAGVHE